MSDKKSENWNMLHHELKHNMQQELSMTRDLLGNMHQEELSLIIQDQPSWNRVMIHRSNMLDRLKTLRLQRIETTQKIVEMLSIHPIDLTLEKLLPLDEDITYEIFNLRDQLISLTERMNLQQHLNYHLIETSHSKLSMTYAEPQKQSLVKQKFKTTVTTYPN